MEQIGLTLYIWEQYMSLYIASASTDNVIHTVISDCIYRGENGFLKLTTTYPGLPVQYSKDGGNTWFVANNNVLVKPWDTLHLRTR